MAGTLASFGTRPASLSDNGLAPGPSSLLSSGVLAEEQVEAHDEQKLQHKQQESDDDSDMASMYSCSCSSLSSSPQLSCSTAPSSPIITRQAQELSTASSSTMGRSHAPSVIPPTVSFTSTDSPALPWSKSQCSWTAIPSSTTTPSTRATTAQPNGLPTSQQGNGSTMLLKELLHDAMQTPASSLSAPSTAGSLPGMPLAMHPRMGRRMGLAVGTGTHPLMPSPAALAPAAMLSTPLMSRSDSEASTSSTASTSTTSTSGYSQGGNEFRFEDDDDEIADELEDDTEDEDEDIDHDDEEEKAYSTSSGRSSGHSSCPSNDSLDSFRLPRNCFPSSSVSSLESFSIASSSSSSSSSTAPESKPARIETPYTFPSPTPISELKPTDLEATLRFSASTSGLPSTSTVEEDTAPPAFFPLQRVSFAPQLKIKTQGGVPLAISGASSSTQLEQHGISGMMLGVTGTIEILDAEKGKKIGRDVIKSQRMIADFATDLTNGLKIWRRDASPIVKEKIKVERQWRRKYNLSEEDLDDERWNEMLAPGTFMLPLSMKIPCSDKLPPSFESAHFRIRYVMSLAIFGSRRRADGKPEVLHVHSIPFTILPSTLPTPAPQIPILTHDSRKTGFLSGITRALSLGGSGQAPSPRLSDKSCTHIICPSLPTSSFSPGSVIPITLRIADCPTEPTDLYIRLSLIRKVYVRDAAYPMVNEWGLPEDVFFEEFCREEEEIVSRWGYVPYSVRAQEGATPGSKAQVIISDITLPVGGVNGEWNHGYSCALDLAPTVSPSMKHGECSWFSPALSKRPPARQEYEKFIHASTRHFVSIEIGFANDKLGDVLEHIGDVTRDMEVPQPNTFTYPSSPSISASTGLPVTNPFPSPRAKRAANGSIFQNLPSFPGKLKEILIPVTIGSVAEPQMSCLLNRNTEATAPASVIPSPPRNAAPQRAATAEESADRAARDADESEAERYERVGDDGEEPWLFPPPSYAAAVTTAPAYT